VDTVAMAPGYKASVPPRIWHSKRENAADLYGATPASSQTISTHPSLRNRPTAPGIAPGGHPVGADVILD